jgi:molybdopterin-guanine dinucleotide biosynthesis protein A
MDTVTRFNVRTKEKAQQFFRPVFLCEKKWIDYMHAFKCDMIERKERKHKVTLIVLSAIITCTPHLLLPPTFVFPIDMGTVTQCNVFSVVDFPLYDLTKRE